MRDNQSSLAFKTRQMQVLTFDISQANIIFKDLQRIAFCHPTLQLIAGFYYQRKRWFVNQTLF